ncbi:MAG: glycosyltransferase family 2 protein [Bacillota bacterium]
MLRCAVIIPALNPPESLVEYVRTLLARGVARVIVVNDGSDASTGDIFRQLSRLDRCTVLSHPVNQGKGRALKTAFAYVLQEAADLTGVVTADADGQHHPDDVCRVVSALRRGDDTLILGVRDFDQAHVPWRSRFGNRLTSRAIRWLFGMAIDDTQTGLRGIPIQHLSWMSELKGERFEYEMNMLLNAIRRRIPIRQVPIRTLYYQRNAGSHYRSIADSLRIFVQIVLDLVVSVRRGDEALWSERGRKRT